MPPSLEDLRRRESTCPACIYRIDVPVQLYHQLGGQVGKDGGTPKAREYFTPFCLVQAAWPFP